MIALYPGSFDPVTKGHLDIVRRALVFCPKLVIAVGGNTAKQNVFTSAERIAMVQQALQETFNTEEIVRIAVQEFSGSVIGFAETIGATVIVKGMRAPEDFAHEERMTIVNRRLNNTIDTVFLLTENNLRDVSSSAVREMAKIGIAPEKFNHYLTLSVRDALLKRVAPNKY